MSEARTVCGLYPGEARAVCEWSKGGGQGSPDSSGRWTAHVEAKGRYEFLRFLSLSKDGKNHDSPQRTTRGYRFINQSEAKENNIFSRSPQRPGRRAKQGQPVDALRLNAVSEERTKRREAAKADKGGCRDDDEGDARFVTAWSPESFRENPQGGRLCFIP